MVCDVRQDLLPRTYQADLDRLYRRVIRPALDELPIGSTEGRGVVTEMEEFLDNAQRQTSALLAQEARRGFALTLAAVFERQIVAWIADRAVDLPSKEKRASFAEQVSAAANFGGVDLNYQSLGAVIVELHTLANVVRHGEGRSLVELRSNAPHVWKDSGSQEPQALAITDLHFRRYMMALGRFWGMADKEPMAIVDPPY